jgi:HPt (histidine-containing phosphotransfer) domain-containing protein
MLDVLPKERVTVSVVNQVEYMSTELKDELARELALCGVELDDGLCYVGGDISQYGRMAVIFTDNYSAAADATRERAGGNDWAAMKFRVHSLKGNARNLGANALSDTAAKLERLCASGDGAYISAALPALYLEWERAKCGLAAFAERLSGILPEQEREQQPAPELYELLDMLKSNQFQNAMDALAILIENGDTPIKALKLREIRQKTDELKFREAEHLLSALMESEADANGS